MSRETCPALPFCTSMPIWAMAGPPLLAALTAVHSVGQRMPPRRVGVSHFIRSRFFNQGWIGTIDLRTVDREAERSGLSSLADQAALNGLSANAARRAVPRPSAGSPR